MTASDSSTADSLNWLGYLTYVDLPSLGTVGGLLMVDRRARPIEFHCTAPLLPTRTQEILYGETLRSALLCDQIGKSLIQQLARAPRLILTNEPMALALRELVDVPIALFAEEQTEDEVPAIAIAGEVAEQGALLDNENWTFGIGAYSFTASPKNINDRETIRDTLRESQGSWDMMEPIERIEEAVLEAHRAAA